MPIDILPDLVADLQQPINPISFQDGLLNIKTIEVASTNLKVFSRFELKYHMLNIYNTPNQPDYISNTTLKTQPLFIAFVIKNMWVAFKVKKTDTYYVKGKVTSINERSATEVIATITYNKYNNEGQVVKATKRINQFRSYEKHHLWDNLIMIWNDETENALEVQGYELDDFNVSHYSRNLYRYLRDYLTEDELTIFNDDCYFPSLCQVRTFNLLIKNTPVSDEGTQNIQFIDMINKSWLYHSVENRWRDNNSIIYLTNERINGVSNPTENIEPLQINNHIKSNNSSKETSTDIMGIIDELKDKMNDGDYLKIANYLLKVKQQGL
jgi:hypothetical protein